MSSSSSDGSAADLLEVGRIEKAHGLRGEVAVSLVTNMVDDRTAVGVTLRAGDRDLVIIRSRPHGTRWLLTFDGVADREAADALRGVTLRAEPLPSDGSDPGPMAEGAGHGDEVVAFVHDLIGRRLVDQGGIDHGPVVAVLDNPASDLLELEDGGLVPLTFYRGLDPDSGAIMVDVPAGLLDDGAAEAGDQRTGA